MLVTLHLQKLRFFAYHGVYEQEKRLGNDFELNISISFRTDKELIEDLQDTINYAAVYELAKSEMLHPRELLETFLSQLAQKIKNQFPQIARQKLVLYKLSMPMVNYQGQTGVELEFDYEQN
ncbi:dihydroneopterin aldolase [Niabella terrae]